MPKNASVVSISEMKPDRSVFNSEIVIKGYDIILENSRLF